jgi:hypothetical protein
MATIAPKATDRLQLWFDHGLGDCVHFAHVLQLYKRRGYEVCVHYEGNKKLVWKAAGIPYVQLEGSARHRWSYAADFNRPQPDCDWSGSKTASNINQHPLPYIGEVDALWEELCSVSLEESCLLHLKPADVYEAGKFLRNLPRPIILLHTSGTNFAPSKNIPHDVVADLYRILLDRSDGSLVVLDWDFRVPTLAHGRFRHIKRDWGHLSLNQLAALMLQSSLLIGVDSGPYHFASLTNLPALGVFHKHYPSCVTLPRARNVNMVRRDGCKDVNIARRARWNVVEYAGNLPAAEEIARHALRMIAGPRYGLQLGRDIMLQQWVRDWALGSTSTSPLADRNHTLDFLLRETRRRFAEPRIVETGCIRSLEDWSGAGCSTYLFAAFINGLGRGKLISVDNSDRHSQFATEATRAWAPGVVVQVADSVDWLRGTDERIDVLYLDSMDIEDPAHADHGLAEIQAAEPKLSWNAIVVYDDSPWEGKWMGKGAKGIPYLLDRGWNILACGYQVLLSRA